MDDERQPIGRFEWERIVRRVTMPIRVKLMALTLATYADPDGSRVRPGRGVLASVTGQSESTVKRQLAVLRDDYGMLDLVSPGGGRGRIGRAAEYRLAVPVDLLDRTDLLPPDENRRVTNGTHQSPVDNPNRRVTQKARQSSESDPIDGSESTPPDELTGQNEQLTGHPGDPPPPTRPTTYSTTQVGRLSTAPPERARDGPTRSRTRPRKTRRRKSR